MKLFLVSIKFGHWLVYAENSAQAEELARYGVPPAEEENATFYGDEKEPAVVTEVSEQKEPGIAWHTYG